MKKYLLFFISAILISLTSCSNKLSNDEVTALISKMPNEIVSGDIKIWLNASNYSKQSISQSFYAENAQLIQRGILTVLPIYEVQEPYEPVSYVIRASFTDSAKVLILGGGNEPYQSKTFIVKCGELQFVEVTGIFQEDNSKIAEIEYKVAFNPTMFADFATMRPKYEKGMIYTRKTIAKEYDNGWKIEN